MPFVLIPIVVALLFLAILYVVLRRRSKVLGCYLVKDDGTLVKEMMTVGKEHPFSALKEELERRVLSGIKEFAHSEGAVTVLHGRKLHLVILSSSRLSEPRAVKFREILAEVDEAFVRRGGDEVILRHDQAFARFERELGRLAGKPQVG